MAEQYLYKPGVMTALGLLLLIVSAGAIGVFLHAGVYSTAMWSCVIALYALSLAASVVWSLLISEVPQGSSLYATLEGIGMLLLGSWVVATVFLCIVAVSEGM